MTASTPAHTKLLYTVPEVVQMTTLCRSAMHEQMWVGLERMYGEGGDFELLRVDVSALVRKTGVGSPSSLARGASAVRSRQAVGDADD